MVADLESKERAPFRRSRREVPKRDRGGGAVDAAGLADSLLDTDVPASVLAGEAENAAIGVSLDGRCFHPYSRADCVVFGLCVAALDPAEMVVEAPNLLARRSIDEMLSEQR